jgi:putative MATE family efflux protein
MSNPPTSGRPGGPQGARGPNAKARGPNAKARGPNANARGANFTAGPVHSHLIRLSGFMFMGFIAMTLSQLIETVYLGILGTEELAAVSFTCPVVMVLQSVAMGIGIGASSIIARTSGAGDREAVRRLVSHCLILVLVVLLLMAFLGRTYSGAIFQLLGAEGRVLALIKLYADIWFLGFPLFALSMIGTSLIRSVGNAAAPGIVMTTGSVLQVIIGPFFIFGLGPFPEMGIEGAAVAFCISRAISFSLCYYIIIFKEELLTSSLQDIIGSWKSILHVGLPAMATNLIMPVSMGIITRLLAGHGPEVVAGFGVGSRIDQMMVMIVMAVSSSIGPFVGQNWGAEQYERVDMAQSLATRFSLAWGAFAFVFMLLAGEFLVSLINDDPIVVETASWYLVIIPLSIGFMGMTAIASSSFNAIGKPLPPLVISILRMFVVYIPMALLFNHLWGYVGIFIATSVSTVILGVLAWQWNRHSLAKLRRQRETTEATTNPA